MALPHLKWPIATLRAAAILWNLLPARAISPSRYSGNGFGFRGLSAVAVAIEQPPDAICRGPVSRLRRRAGDVPAAGSSETQFTTRSWLDVR